MERAAMRMVLLFVVLMGLAGCAGAPPPQAEGSPLAAAEAKEDAAGGMPSAPGANKVTGTLAGETCEGARSTWAKEMASHGGDLPEPSKEHDQALKNLLNAGAYLNECGISSSMSVSICAAIVGGKLRGVTAVVDGGTQAQADCIVEAVQKMAFPSSPAMSITRTQFAATP